MRGRALSVALGVTLPGPEFCDGEVGCEAGVSPGVDGVWSGVEDLPDAVEHGAARGVGRRWSSYEGVAGCEADVERRCG